MLVTQSAGSFLKRKHTINLGGEILDLSFPVVMGIINLSPDSFYDGGKIKNEKDLLNRVEQMLGDGAVIIDVGAVSTRPGSDLSSTKEELDLLLPAIKAIRKKFSDIKLSIDTFRSWVAVRIIDEYGPVMVNDISGGTLDSNMFDTIARVQVPYVLSHIKGVPKTMQDEPEYSDVIKEVSVFFSEMYKRLTKAGVNDVILDPGFGFGKNIQHNFELLNKLDSFKVYQLPVMVGLSRKSMIWKVLEVTPELALNGTTALNTMALLGGADILRVHDVKEAMECIRLFQELKIAF